MSPLQKSLALMSTPTLSSVLVVYNWKASLLNDCKLGLMQVFGQPSFRQNRAPSKNRQRREPRWHVADFIVSQISFWSQISSCLHVSNDSLHHQTLCLQPYLKHNAKGCFVQKNSCYSSIGKVENQNEASFLCLHFIKCCWEGENRLKMAFS